jgi:hypothetical protein
MRRGTFVSVRTAPSSSEAGFLAAKLRSAGLHPADVPLVAPFAADNGRMSFPVEVPAEEAGAARKVLESHYDEAA